MIYVVINKYANQMVQHLAVPIIQKSRKFYFTKSLEKNEAKPLEKGGCRTSKGKVCCRLANFFISVPNI